LNNEYTGVAATAILTKEAKAPAYGERRESQQRSRAR
jgi:hypothetical protein